MEVFLQSPGSISHDRTTSNVAEPCPGAAERSVFHVVALAPSEEAGAALEGRSPIADPSERLPVDPKSPLKGPAPGRPGRTARFARATLKTTATLLILATAVLAALVIWNSYVTAPWTRDGSVRVQVASIAPQVSGQITEVRIVDNQFVHLGEVLYLIDPFDFQVALDTAKAQLRQKAADLQVKRIQAERRMHLRPRHDTGGAAAICRQRHPGGGRLRRRPATARPGRHQPQAVSGAQPRERLCHQSSDAGGRLCSRGHDQHLGD
jgi:hypothetical protein